MQDNDPGYSLVCIACDITLEYKGIGEYGYIYACSECGIEIAIFDTPESESPMIVFVSPDTRPSAN